LYVYDNIIQYSMYNLKFRNVMENIQIDHETLRLQVIESLIKAIKDRDIEMVQILSLISHPIPLQVKS